QVSQEADDAVALVGRDADGAGQREAARMQTVGDLDSIGLTAVPKRRLAMQRVPERPALDAGGRRPIDDPARASPDRRVEQDGKHPEARNGPRLLAAGLETGEASERLNVGARGRPLGLDEPVELLELRDTERRLDVRQP